METFSALLALCEGSSLLTGEFPSQRPVTRSFDVFYDLHLNKRWVNNCEAGDLRRHGAHYDVIVISHHFVMTASQIEPNNKIEITIHRFLNPSRVNIFEWPCVLVLNIASYIRDMRAYYQRQLTSVHQNVNTNSVLNYFIYFFYVEIQNISV